MNRTTRTPVVAGLAAAILALAESASASSTGLSDEGSLFGTDYSDNSSYTYTCQFGDGIESKMRIDVTGWGEGTNDLIVEVQQKNSTGNWITCASSRIEMSGVGTGVTETIWYDTRDIRSGSTEYVRFRFKRAALTAGIYWHYEIAGYWEW